MQSSVVWCLPLVLLQVITGIVVSGQEYYVTPSLPPSPDCSKFEHCHTLEYYAVNSSNFFQSKINISLIFFAGTHNLSTKLESENINFFQINAFDSGKEVSVSSDRDISFTSIGTLILTNFKIIAISQNTFYFFNVQNLKLQHLSLVNYKLSMNGSYLTNKSELVRHDTDSALSDSELHITQQVGIDSNYFFMQNPLLNITVSHTNFTQSPIIVNQASSAFSMFDCILIECNVHIEMNPDQLTLGVVIVENSIFINIDQGFEVLCHVSDIVPVHVLIPVSITFAHIRMVNSILYFEIPNLDCKFTSVYLTNSSISISSSSAIIKITNCTIIGNDGKHDGVKIVESYDTNLTLTIENSYLNNNFHGLFVETGNVQITLTNSTFSNNTHSGIFIETTYNLAPAMVNITDCTVENNSQVGINIQSNNIKVIFSRSYINRNKKPLNASGELEQVANTGTGAAAVMIIGIEDDNESIVTLTDCTFENNLDYALESKTVQVFRCSKVILNGYNRFINNHGTPLDVYKSQVIVSGHIEFFNNSAFRGGGLTLIYSKILLERNLRINFENNSVTDVGGGLYYPSIAEDKDKFCFYLLNINKHEKVKDLNITIHFVTNHASNGGEIIYGAAFDDDCYVSQSNHDKSSSAYEHIFKFDNKLSSFSSEPTRVCLCNQYGIPQCKVKSFILFNFDHSIYPGETITLSAVVVGKGFGTTSGSVYAAPIHSPDHTDKVGLELSQYSQQVHYKACNKLQYTIRSPESKNVTLVLTASVASTQSKLPDAYVDYLIKQFNKTNSDELLSIPVYATMSVEDCPPGFTPSNDLQPACECAEMLREFGINNCTIRNHTGLIERPGGVWIGIIHGKLSAHKYCPYRYCKSKGSLVNLNDSNSQCTSNRTGILCGKCETGFSLALGSNDCIECYDNSYVALIVPILVGTLFLVVLIKVLDLTVAKGMINGLIFYANIMWANKNILLSSSSESSLLYAIQIPIAWLNLEFGIETCFIEGMDAIGKTWLHFGQDFLYIIVVTSLIIISSRYSKFVTRMLGNNTVPVLATIVFLSYTKLLQTIIDTLSFSTLKAGNDTHIVWLLDGNVPYFGLQHSILFVVAIISFVVLWLPYTTCLLFGQCLRRMTDFRLLKWMDKQKPYFDAYYGPFKDEYHYWFGLLLVARSVLLIVNAGISAISPQGNLIAIVAIGGCLLIHPYQYKNWIHSILDKIFCSNLIIVASGVLYCELKGVDQAPVILTSAVFSLVILVLIIGYSALAQIRRLKCFKQSSKSNYEDIDVLQYEESSHQSQNENSTYREPLLDSGNHSRKLKYLSV